jgi:hypothetical protein
MRKDLHEYSYEEIKHWEKGEYPSAQGRTWRRAVRETTYKLVRKTLPAQCAPAVDGLARGLGCLSNPFQFLPPFIGGTLVYITTPLMISLVADSGGVITPGIDAGLISLLHTFHAILGLVNGLFLVLVAISTVMQPD